MTANQKGPEMPEPQDFGLALISPEIPRSMACVFRTCTEPAVVAYTVEELTVEVAGCATHAEPTAAEPTAAEPTAALARCSLAVSGARYLMVEVLDGPGEETP